MVWHSLFWALLFTVKQYVVYQGLFITEAWPVITSLNFCTNWEKVLDTVEFVASEWLLSSKAVVQLGDFMSI